MGKIDRYLYRINDGIRLWEGAGEGFYNRSSVDVENDLILPILNRKHYLSYYTYLDYSNIVVISSYQRLQGTKY